MTDDAPADDAPADDAGLARTPLYDLHLALGARMVPFAGYEMPVQYAPGVLKEHLHCRTAAGLFDVSHMGQIEMTGAPVAEMAAALEALVPADLVGLAEGRQRYGLFTTDQGGILDDLMIARRADRLFLVVNAATKQGDLAHLRRHLSGFDFALRDDRGLIALQGPGAEAALAAIVPGVADSRFMDARTLATAFGELWISRSGYTGEDGFEISVGTDQAAGLARALLTDPEVQPIGLGARDSLRLEAGLCLYGTDIDETTTPVEAALDWAIGKARRPGGARAGGFPGADRTLGELSEGPHRRRVGIRPEGRAPMRGGTPLFEVEAGGPEIGRVTSGAFGPSVGAPVAMGYVPAVLAAPGTPLWGEVRGKRLPASVARLPFHPASYKR